MKEGEQRVAEKWVKMSDNRMGRGEGKATKEMDEGGGGPRCGRRKNT